MKIHIKPTVFVKNYNNYNLYNNFAYPLGILKSTPQDTVSFGAIKKNKFSGIDLIIVNRFKAPIEKFNTNEDFQNWCREKTDEINGKVYKGKYFETDNERKKAIAEWRNYLSSKNGEYSDSEILLIMDGITKDLKRNTFNLPPVLYSEILRDTIDEIRQNTYSIKNYQPNFIKRYEENLKTFYLKDENLDETRTGWVIIPSKADDCKNFKHNTDKFRTLSPKNWCTSGFNAENHLKKETIHIYFENGKPKIEIGLQDNQVCEIQGEKNDWKIPLASWGFIQQYINKNGFQIKPESGAENEILEIQKRKDEYKKIKKTKGLDEAIKNNDTAGIFKCFKIKCKENKDGTYTISKYHQPGKYVTYEDLGISEKELLKNVTIIGGKADFSNSILTPADLVNIRRIDGSVDILNSKKLDFADFDNIEMRSRFIQI